MNKISGYVFAAMIPFLVYGIGTGHYHHVVTLIIAIILSLFFFSNAKKNSEMKLTHPVVENIKRQLPDSNIELDWKEDRGRARGDGDKIKCGPFLVFSGSEVTEMDTTTKRRLS